jgi:hypothetical protein
MFRLLKNKEFITSIIINSGLTYYSDCIIGRKKINYDYIKHTSNIEIYYEFDKYKIIPIFTLSLTFGYISIPAFLTTMYIQK